jgi:SAM-dependent methyltransferase
VEFGQRWIADLALDTVEMQHADILACDLSAYEPFDLAVCITGAFGYFRPIRESAPAELLSVIGRAVHPSGSALLEVYKLPAERLRMLEINHGKLKTWQALPPEDRFAYYLDDFEYHADRKILRHGKTFIGRDGSIDTGRVEILAYYTAAEVAAQLRNAGFPDVDVFDDFADGSYDEAISTQIVVLARRFGRTV